MKNRVSDNKDNARETLEDLKNSDLHIELATALVASELERCERKIKVCSIHGLVFALLSLASLLLAHFVDISFLILGIVWSLISVYFSIECDIEKVKRGTILSDKLFTASTIKLMYEFVINDKKSAKKEKK